MKWFSVSAMFTSEFNLDSVIEGEMFELKCSVYSEDVDVKWLKNDIEIKQNGNISIEHSGRYHHLTVHSSKLNDSGQYTIVAGNAKKEITVHVKGNSLNYLLDIYIIAVFAYGNKV